MTLPASGTISISQIAGELNLATSSSLRTLSAAAGFSAPDSFSEFYGFSYIPVSFGSITDSTRTSTQITAWRPINHTNMVLGQIIRVDLQYYFYSSGTAYCFLQRRENGSAWATIDQLSSPGGSTSGTYQWDDIDYNDTTDILMDLYSGGGSAYMYCDIDYTIKTSGNCLSYITGTYWWSEAVY